jgi:serine/threonine protein kinase
MPFAASENLVDDDEITEDLEGKIVRGDWAFHSDGPYSWDYISAEAKDLIEKLLTVDPDERWTAKQCLQHPWITKGESDLAASGNLSAVKENLKKFNAKRKLKSAVRSVIMLNRMGLKDLAAAGQASPQRDSAETTRAAEEVDGSQHD